MERATRAEQLKLDISHALGSKQLVEKIETPFKNQQFTTMKDNAWGLTILLSSFEPYNSKTELENNLGTIERNLTTIIKVIESHLENQVKHIKNQRRLSSTVSAYLTQAVQLVGFTILIFAACMYVDAVNPRFGFHDNVYIFWTFAIMWIGAHICLKYHELMQELVIVAELNKLESLCTQTMRFVLNMCMQEILSVCDKQSQVIKNLHLPDHDMGSY